MATINKIDILIPTYNGSKWIADTLKSLLSQDYKNFKIVISDDASTDNTLKAINKLKNKRIDIHRHTNNVGYPKNLERGRQYCHAPFLFLMGQDDILASGALKKVIDIFEKNPNIGAITRPYYWFDKDIKKPVRIKKQLNAVSDEIITTKSNSRKIVYLFDSLDQLSGLAFRTKYIDIPFYPEIFPCHIYPFASIFTKHPIMYQKDYTVAVRISSSQSRHLSSIYDKSPIQTWYTMIQTIFAKPKYKNIKNNLINNFVTKNYIGLVQIKNYSTYKNLLREIFLLIKYRPQNLTNPSFYFFSLGTILTPASILIPLVDWYKNNLYSKTINPINFPHSQ